LPPPVPPVQLHLRLGERDQAGGCFSLHVDVYCRGGTPPRCYCCSCPALYYVSVPLRAVMTHVHCWTTAGQPMIPALAWAVINCMPCRNPALGGCSPSSSSSITTCCCKGCGLLDGCGARPSYESCAQCLSPHHHQPPPAAARAWTLVPSKQYTGGTTGSTQVVVQAVHTHLC
jgi:hypothetical protein